MNAIMGFAIGPLSFNFTFTITFPTCIVGANAIVSPDGEHPYIGASIALLFFGAKITITYCAHS